MPGGGRGAFPGSLGRRRGRQPAVEEREPRAPVWGRLSPRELGLRGVRVRQLWIAVWPCRSCCVTSDVLLKHSELNILSKMGLVKPTTVVVRIKREVE